jgi:hypothetical protein
MTIGLLGSAYDRTFYRVYQRALARGLNPLVADLDSLFSQDIPKIQSERYEFINNWLCKSLRNCNTLYYRVPPAVSVVEKWKSLTSVEHIVNCIYAAISNLKQVNVFCPPGANASNSCKILHGIDLSSISKDFQISVPNSLLSNNVEEIHHFCTNYSQVVAKGGSGYKSQCCIFDIEAFLGNVQTYTIIPPLLLQERISGPDIRVHVLGCHRMFSELTVSLEVDSRFTSRRISEQIEVPARIANFCVKLCEVRQLDLAGIDFKLTEDGRWYILEINSMPDFYGYDRRLGHAISDALLDTLMVKE